MYILLADAFSEDLPKRLASYGQVDTTLEHLVRAKILIVRSKTKVHKEMIDSAPALKLIIRGGVGVDTIDIDYAKKKSILVENTPEASTLAVAELAMAFMLALPNRISQADQSMKQGKWLKSELARSELFGKVLGLIGLGRIAREVALRARVFGMTVIAYDKYLPNSDAAKMVSIEELYAKSDYISIHTPLTEETKGMINEDALARMKRGVYLINTCRGQVVKTEAVVTALHNGRLAGYASDVYEQEPPTNSSLLSAPGTILSPHYGASTSENLLRLGDCIIDRIQKFVHSQEAK